MVPLLFFLPAAVRGWLARLVGLRWARLGRFDLVVPAAIAIVIWTSAPQLGDDVVGVPFWVAWAAGTAAVVVALQLASGRLRATRPATPAAPGRGLVGRSLAGRGRPTRLGLILVVGVIVGWVLYDVAFWGQTIHLYDLDVYLGSAGRWLDGGQPYMTAPIATWQANPRQDFFLYPPPLLPFFAALSRLPEAPVAGGWVALLIACAYRSFRALGLPRVWSVALLAFPPLAIGFESGNVASITFLLFVVGARAGGTLIVDGLFKVQSGLPALWLIRQRRWRGIVAGMAVIAALVLVTLPLVGLDSWRAWWAGLGYRAASQAAVPALFGYSYAGMLPGAVFAAFCVVAVGLALLLRGRSGLAAMGLASIFASPSLWPHGFVFALPALLMLEDGGTVWLLLGAGAFGSNMWLLFYGGWLAVIAARRLPSGRLHPLAGTDGPWPKAAQLRPTGPRALAGTMTGAVPAASAASAPGDSNAGVEHAGS